MEPDQSNQSSIEPAASKIGAMAVKNADSSLVEPGEQVMDVIHRHAVGIIGIYAQMVIAVGAIFALAILANNDVFGQIPSGYKGPILGGAILLSGIILVPLLIQRFVYRQCRVIVTDKSLVTVVQKSLFSKKTSRLSMSNVEDVSAEQNGILPSMFNYGTLTIQTAGEEDNFIFPLCPKPNDIADKILEARQAYARAVR
ncbi:MAG TPA: PH domain-containing protein [Candidatus Saccharimonadales bacterium]|nr:PH domain-containing protein [Candidatus Saccharimonadales bacterium]